MEGGTLPMVTKLLQQFEDFFQEPRGLPPSSGVYDHRIPLKTDAKPVSTRPYRYLLKQKIMEQLVQ